jgi:hypothetical protein
MWLWRSHHTAHENCSLYCNAIWICTGLEQYTASFLHEFGFAYRNEIKFVAFELCIIAACLICETLYK